MENNAAEKTYSLRVHPFRRLLAFVLALLMLGGTVLASLAQIRETGMEYVGTVLEQASRVTQDNTAYLKQSTLDRAWQILRNVVGRPRSFEEYETYASLAVARGEYEKAAEYMEGSLKTYKGDSPSEEAVLWLRKGSLFTLCQDQEQALVCYDKAVSLDNSLSDAFLLRAQAHYDLGDTYAAADDILAYEALCGESPAIKGALGGLYEIAEDYEKAEKCYSDSIDSGSYELSYLSSRARCRILLGDNTGGQEDLERFFREGGQDDAGDYYAMLGMCRSENGDYENAIKAFHLAASKGYANAVMLYSQCVACAFMAEDFETVIRDGHRALELTEANGNTPEEIGDLYRWVALAAFLLERYEEAAEDFVNAVRFDPSIPDMHYYAGVCLMQIGKSEEALDYLLESASRGEYVTVCYYDAALCSLQKEDYETARDQLQAAIDAADDEEAVTEAKELLHEVKRELRHRP